MGEHIPVALTRRLFNQMGFQRLIHQRQKFGLGDVFHDYPQHPEIELPAHHRSRGQRRIALVRETAQPLADDIADSLGQPKGAGSIFSSASLGGHQPNDFGQEKRVALGVGMQRLDQVRIRVLTSLHLEKAAHISYRQAAEDVPPKCRQTGKLGQRFSHGRTARGLCFPGSEHDH